MGISKRSFNNLYGIAVGDKAGPPSSKAITALCAWITKHYNTAYKKNPQRERRAPTENLRKLTNKFGHNAGQKLTAIAKKNVALAITLAQEEGSYQTYQKSYEHSFQYQFAKLKATTKRSLQDILRECCNNFILDDNVDFAQRQQNLAYFLMTAAASEPHLQVLKTTLLASESFMQSSNLSKVLRLVDPTNRNGQATLARKLFRQLLKLERHLLMNHATKPSDINIRSILIADSKLSKQMFTLHQKSAEQFPLDLMLYLDNNTFVTKILNAHWLTRRFEPKHPTVLLTSGQDAERNITKVAAEIRARLDADDNSKTFETQLKELLAPKKITLFGFITIRTKPSFWGATFASYFKVAATEVDTLLGKLKNHAPTFAAKNVLSPIRSLSISNSHLPPESPYKGNSTTVENTLIDSRFPADDTLIDSRFPTDNTLMDSRKGTRGRSQSFTYGDSHASGVTFLSPRDPQHTRNQPFEESTSSAENTFVK